MNNKKGISAIVATVLIILITVAAVTIIWAAIIPMIQDQIGSSTECFDASAALSVTTDFSCVTYYADNTCLNYNTSSSGCSADAEVTSCESAANCSGEFKWNKTGEVSVQIHRGTGNFVLAGVEIIVGAAGNTNATTFMSVENGGSEGVPDANGDKVYTYNYTSSAAISEAGVAAIVEAGNTEKTCDKSGMVAIPDCA